MSVTNCTIIDWISYPDRRYRDALSLAMGACVYDLPERDTLVDAFLATDPGSVDRQALLREYEKSKRRVGK